MGGGGSTTYVVSLPIILKLVGCPIPGCPSISHSAGQMREHFMYNFLLEGRGATGGEVYAALLRHVRNAHAGEATDQAPEESAFLQ